MSIGLSQSAIRSSTKKELCSQKPVKTGPEKSLRSIREYSEYDPYAKEIMLPPFDGISKRNEVVVKGRLILSYDYE